MIDKIANGLRKLSYRLMRAGSPGFRAYTDLFDRDFEGLVDWKSGLGTGGQLLYGLTRALGPEVVVEIGSARGRSSCFLARACKDNGHGKVYAIDPHMHNAWSDVGTSGDNLEFMRARLKSYNLQDYCEIIRATSADAAESWNRSIDLIFIDGNHSYEGVKADFELFRPWFSEKALVVFHDSTTDLATWEAFRDTHQMPEELGVPVFLDELKRSGHPSITLPAIPGITILDPRVGGYEFIQGKGWSEMQAKA